MRRENLRQPGGGQASLGHTIEGVRRQGLTGEGAVALLAGGFQHRWGRLRGEVGFSESGTRSGHNHFR